jgi:hypothetical protein
MRIADLENLAYQVASLPSLPRRPVSPDAAIYKYVRSHPEVGPIAMHEGGKATITVTGRIVWWHGGDDVTVQ